MESSKASKATKSSKPITWRNGFDSFHGFDALDGKSVEHPKALG
jgi:hypothetical protein